MKINRSKKLTAYVCAAAFVLLAASCNNLKYIADNDALYTGATVKIKNTPVESRQKKVLTSLLSGLTRPKPNSTVLGMRLKLSIYNFSNKHKKGLGKLLKKYGEPPVLLSQVNLDRNVLVLSSNLENRGFFHAKVSGDTIVKHKKAHAEYDVETGPQYTINNVIFPEDSSKISTAIRDIGGQTILKKDAPYILDGIKAERTRIDIALKERGFYFFSPDQLIVLVDSTIGGDKVNLYVKFKDGTPFANLQPYVINDVYIYSNYRLNSAAKDTLKSDSINYGGSYYVIDRNKTFNPKVFERIMMFHPGDLYNRKDHDLSLSRLINLGTFKFVKSRFEVVPDTFKLNSYYYLTPLPKKSLSLEVGASSRQPTNANGSDITVRWSNKNAFKGAELLSVSAYAGSEVQVSGQYGGNTFRTGAEANLSIPRFVIPFFKFNTSGSYVPRTRMQLGYDILNRTKYFTLNSYRGQLGYVWKESATKEHQLNPIAINYVQPLNITKDYQDSISKNPLFGRATQQQFIIGSNYNFNYNQLVNKEKNATGFYFNGLLDLSGNLAGLVTGANVNKGDTVELFGSRFSQYVKTELDTRYYLKVGLNHQWANRLIIGFGLPYGNSWQLPYSKQFVAGGSNSLRGFRARSVGPGIYKVGTKNSKGILPDATGDIKLEMNTEFRAKLYSIFYGAFFVDAGNVWLYNSDSSQPGGKFSKNFLNQLAVDAGVGLRIDVQILLLRLDVAFPIRDPSLIPPGQLRYFTNAEYRRRNVVFNLAIGLPF
jgi:outer membrane protein insertion porin family